MSEREAQARTRARTWLVRAALGLTVGLVTLAAGGAEARAEDAFSAEAKQRFDEGHALWGRGEHEQARLKYAQAWAVLKEPDVLFNLARAEHRVGHVLGAYHHFRELLKLPQTDPAHTTLAKKLFADLGAKVSLITLAPGTPRGTQVRVDGVVAGEAPLADPIAVLAGPHEVVVTFGQRRRKRPVACPAERTVVVALEGDTSPPPPSPPPAEREAGASWTVPVVLGVVGVAGLGAGAVMGAMSASSDDELRLLSVGAPCPRPGAPGCQPLEDAASKASGLGTGSIVGYVGGGVFLGAAVVSALVLRPWATPNPRERDRVSLVPVVGPGGAGGALLGRF